MKKNNDSFLDANTLLAILLSFGLFIGWQVYLNKKYPNRDNENTELSAAKPQENAKQAGADIKGSSVTAPNASAEANLEQKSAVKMEEPEQTLDFDLPHLDAVISSKGFGFKEVVLKAYSDREEENIRFVSADQVPLFATKTGDKWPLFNLKLLDSNKVQGTARIDNFDIVKTIKINDEKYFADVELTLKPRAGASLPLVTTYFNKTIQKVESSFLTPSYDNKDLFAIDFDGEQRETIAFTDPIDKVFKQVKIAAINSQYFALALVDSSSVKPSLNMSFIPESLQAQMRVIHKASELKPLYKISYKIYFGPKKYDLLGTIDDTLPSIVNYGFFGFFGKFLIGLLRWFHSLFGNWGFAIIGLTLLLRTLLLPVMVSSYKSMRKMQIIQPKMKALKEKYKDDSQTMNLKTMELMKKEKANPLGGCLPMVVQIPIFFAFYQMLGNSIELYKAPFIFWIQDLSLKDPYYVLPALVGIFFFLQQKITPTPIADPTQAKVMKFMPVLFSFFMIAIPSGVNLYIFVSTAFGILQQQFFMKDRRAKAQ